MDVSLPKFLLLLVFACGAVNVVFYTVGQWSGGVQMYKTSEEFIELQYGDVDRTLRSDGNQHDSHKLSKGRQPPFITSQELNRSLRKLKNADNTESIASRDSVTSLEPEAQRIFTFTINPHNACERNVSLDGNVRDIVVMVISHVRNFYRRQAIRNTWGSVVQFMNASLVFLVGIDQSEDTQMQIKKESDLYGDLIQVEILDVYENLTPKSIAMLQWFNDYCKNSQFFLKTDDDMYVNLQNILNAARKPHVHRFFLCHVFKKAEPIRNANSKWYTSYKEFDGLYFPTYCSGTAYLFSSGILGELYKSSMKTKAFRMEDVFITGFVAEHRDIIHIHEDGFSYTKRKPTGCVYKKVLTGHEVTVRQMYQIFAQITGNEIDCETHENKVLKRAEEELM